MMLKELIQSLEKLPRDLVVKHGFNNPHSYRGYYDQLAFEPASDVTIGSMLDCAKEAVNSTYQGYKGGDFRMTELTDCWLAHYGNCGEPIYGIWVDLIVREVS